MASYQGVATPTKLHKDVIKILMRVITFNSNCVIVDQVFEHEIPQNKKVILNTKLKFVCPLAVHPDMMYNHDNCDFI